MKVGTFLILWLSVVVRSHIHFSVTRHRALVHLDANTLQYKKNKHLSSRYLNKIHYIISVSISISVSLMFNMNRQNK